MEQEESLRDSHTSGDGDPDNKQINLLIILYVNYNIF